MNRIGIIALNVGVALYLFASGIIGINNSSSVFSPEKGGEIGKMVRTIFGNTDFSNILIVVLAVCAIAAGIFLLLELFNIEVKVTDVILLVFVIIWVVFIVIVDIIAPIQSNRDVKVLDYLMVLASHLVVLGALFTASKRLGGGWAA